MGKRKKILQDHSVVGKKLLPPFNQFLNKNESPFIETPYISMALQEIIWQGLLIDKFGVRIASEITLRLLLEINLVRGVEKGKLFCFISNFELLSQKEVNKILSKLSSNDEFEKIKTAILPFIKVFPECPLRILFQESIPEYTNDDLTYIKNILNPLLNKISKETSCVLANIIFYMFKLDILHVTKESSLLKINEIQSYPNTDLSKQVASALRASINLIMQQEIFILKESNWKKYFWNRAHQLEPYKIDTLYFD